METIVVYFKDVAIGELTFVNNNYVYKTYEDGINKAIEKAYPLFLYDVYQDFVAPFLPESISGWIPTNENSNLYIEAGINESDSAFEKLVKISKLNLNEQDVWIKSK